MKKFTLVASAVLAFTVAVNAQTASTKVSKQIKVLDWLNVAVADGNQVEGGLHSYAAWTDVVGATAKLKTAQVKVGMLITITGENATYRLKSWVTPADLPLITEWERVGDVVIVADLAGRDALLDAAKAKLAIGTTVLVAKNALGDPQSFIYVGGTVDVDRSGAADAADVWFSFGDNSANAGYIYVASVNPATVNPFTGDFTTVALTDGFIADADGKATSKSAIDAATDKKLTSLVQATIDLASSSNVPVIAFPKAWSKPNFLVLNGTEYTQLQDCWTVHYIKKGGVDYQVWVADNAFANGSTGLKLIVQ